jgi:hypothetical protein
MILKSPRKSENRMGRDLNADWFLFWNRTVNIWNRLARQAGIGRSAFGISFIVKYFFRILPRMISVAQRVQRLSFARNGNLRFHVTLYVGHCGLGPSATHHVSAPIPCQWDFQSLYHTWSAAPLTSPISLAWIGECSGRCLHSHSARSISLSLYSSLPKPISLACHSTGSNWDQIEETLCWVTWYGYVCRSAAIASAVCARLSVWTPQTRSRAVLQKPLYAKICVSQKYLLTYTLTSKLAILLS